MKRFVSTYKMAFFYGGLFSLNALTASIVASFLNVNWSQLSGTEQFLIVVLVIQNWTGTMLAFMNKTMSRVEQGLPPVEYARQEPQPPKTP
jgi:hypothetical protein